MMRFRIINHQTNETVAIVNNREDLKGYHKWPYRIFYIEEDDNEENIEMSMNFNLSVDVNIKVLRDNAFIPTQADKGSAGYHLYAAIDEPVIIAPHTTEKIGTGIALELPIGLCGAIFARSGLATKKGLRPANAVGVCDPSYRGEYIVALHNDGLVSQTVEPGERIAQLVIMPYAMANFIEVDELSDTERGDGGFGHSGTK